MGAPSTPGIVLDKELPPATDADLAKAMEIKLAWEEEGVVITVRSAYALWCAMRGLPYSKHPLNAAGGLRQPQSLSDTLHDVPFDGSKTIVG